MQYDKVMIRKKRGFTLIELLVVVAIIGVLSALLMSNFVGVRQRARDAQRKSDVRQLQSALELYRADVGAYPSSATLSTCGNGVSFKSQDNTSTYMQAVPCDPSTGSPYSYTSNDGTTYTLITCLENGNDSQKDSSNAVSCSTGGTYSYTVTNP